MKLLSSPFVNSIGGNAIKSCTSPTKIKISDHLSNIGDYAFYSCSSCCLDKIDHYTFIECSSLNEIINIKHPNSGTICYIQSILIVTNFFK